LWQRCQTSLVFCPKLLKSRKMKKIEYLIVLVLSLFVLIISFYPIYYRLKATPIDRFYVGTTFYTADYAGYVSTIKQGINGNFWYEDKFTTEKSFPKTFLYFPYLVLGRIAGFLGISAIAMYHLSRFVFGLFYLFAIYFLIKQIFAQENLANLLKRLTAFIFVLFSSSFPIMRNAVVTVPNLSRMIAEVQVFNRFVIQPHFLLGNISLIICLILFIRFWEKKNNTLLILSGFIVFFTTFFRPSNMILYLGVVFSFTLINSLIFFRSSVKWGTDDLKFFIVNFLFFLPAISYLYYLQQKYPFLPYFLYDKENSGFLNLWDIVLLLGPVFLLSLPSFLIFKNKNRDGKILLLILFIIVNFFLALILPNFYQVNSLRFVQTPLFVVFSILAAFSIFRLCKNIIVITIVVLVTVILSFPTLWLDFWHEVHLYYDAYYIWPPKEYMTGLKFLEDNSSSQDTVLTYQSLSGLVPMISGNTVFWGHTNETLDYHKKTSLVEKFYKGEMSEQEAKDFLEINGIKYILVGREEKGLGKFLYGFLERVFENHEILIFKK